MAVHFSPTTKDLKVDHIVGDEDPAFNQGGFGNELVPERSQVRVVDDGATVDFELDKTAGDGRREHLI
jgi:hypothetical protein